MADIDYAALARQYGGTSQPANQPSTPDYAALAAQYGGQTSPAQAAPQEGSRARAAKQSEGLLGKALMNLVPGAIRGAGSIGATLLAPVDIASDALAGKGLSLDANRQRRDAMTGGLEALGADPNDPGFKVGKFGAEVAGTLGVGGGVANAAARVAPGVAARVPGLVQAVRTSGMTTGPAAPGVAGAAVNAATRAAGGAITGGASAGLVNPSDAAAGAVVGGIIPGILKLVGMAGTGVYQAFKGGQPGAGKMLADAMGVSEPELQAIVAAAKAAPDAVVPGSKLTLAQALQTQGANQPSVKMLERIVAGGPGGDALLRRYEDQGAARLAALQAEGAQTYQGAAREEATRAGDKIGAVLRTQAGDDKAAARAAWETLYGRGAREGVALELPLDAMDAAMRPLGPGTVGAGKDANALMRAAQEIGTDTIPATMPTVARVGETSNDKTLGQAVRAIGIHPNALQAGGMGGEVRWLRESLKGGRGLVNKNGQSLDHLSERMYEAGYLEHPDPSELIAKLAEEAQGAPVYSNAVNGARAQYMAQGGDIPARAGNIQPKPVPFEEFQRLRRSAGELSAKPNISGTEAAVLGDLRNALEARVDSAAAGNLRPGEVMPPGFREQYNAARGMTRENALRYKQGNNIGQILRKPAGQDYTLTGDEITNKLWHGGAGLAGDVANLRAVLSDNNRDPAMNALRQFIMTDAASKTTASGGLGAALPRYVETRMPGLQEAMTPEQFSALSSVAGDIRNAEAAAAVPGLRGSDTQAKITRALDAGLLDSSIAKTLGNALSIKGVGLGSVRNKLADMVVQHKGRTIAELLSNPKAAAAALEDRAFAKSLDSKTLKALAAAAHRAAPLLAAD
jgi:hypothetical protein